MRSFLVKRRKTFLMFLSLCAVITLVSVLILSADTAEDAPSVRVHFEPTEYDDSKTVRMVISVSAPDGFDLAGFVMSYDNRYVFPVDRQSGEYITPTYCTEAQQGTDAPFRVLAENFSQTPAVWLTQGNRTGFSFDVFSTAGGVTSSGYTNVFAFYFRIPVGYLPTGEFRFENGSMLCTYNTALFVRPGIVINSGETTYVWGIQESGADHILIPDGNVETPAYGPSLLPVYTPTPSPPLPTLPPIIEDQYLLWNRNLPTVHTRNESVEIHNGYRIFRMLISVYAPNGFTGFSAALFYDNQLIIPVCVETFEDLSVYSGQTMSSSPFRMYELDSENMVTPGGAWYHHQNYWLVYDDRTVVSLGTTISETEVAGGRFVTLYAFYYRVINNNFGALQPSVYGFDYELFAHPGVRIISDGYTYAWGYDNYYYREIPDTNILLDTWREWDIEPIEPAQTPTPMPTLTPSPATPTPTTTPAPVLTPTPTPLPVLVTITLDPGHGVLPAGTILSVTDTLGFSVYNLPIPSNHGYYFGGWGINNVQISEPYTVTQNVTLHAIWTSTQPGSTPIPHPPQVLDPTPTPTPSPTPSAGTGTGTRPNPQTNDMGTGFAIFGAVILMGIATGALISMGKRHRAHASQYETDMKRHDREKRISDFVNKK